MATRQFSEFDFIRLFCAMHYKARRVPIINHHALEKKLYPFYDVPEYKELFQDIVPKKDGIYKESNYLDLQKAFTTARIVGLLVPIHGAGALKSIVFCNDDIASEITSTVAPEMVDKMARLFVMLENVEEAKHVKKNIKK